MAVEMAKLSLWLLTFARERPFSFLDHAIREGDSLLGIYSLDQLRALHFEPEHGRELHDGALFDVLRPLGDLVDEAARYRLQLEEQATRDIQDAKEKIRLDALAHGQTKALSLIADALSAIAVTFAESSPRDLDAAFVGLGDIVHKAISDGGTLDNAASGLADATRPYRVQVDRENPASVSRCPLHWPLEFPEVFVRGRSGFDLIVGNPPFLGGQRITGRLGLSYRAFLVRFQAKGRPGSADLVAYFFLLGSKIARRFAFVATNTIGQGDTREVALDALLGASWVICRAEKSRAWPGTAAIQVAEVWCRQEQTAEPSILSGSLVPGISALLLPANRTVGNPYRLQANAATAYIGSYVLGLGFTMAAEAARRLIEEDPRNREVLFPYINGEDICDRVITHPERWIIDFHDWGRERASRYVKCFAQVNNYVRPQRESNKIKQRREVWWQFTRRCPELYSAIGGMRTIVVMPLVSKFSMPLRVPNGYVYSHMLAIFGSESNALYGLVSSEVHRVWSRARGSTLETRARYTPTDCFETFALPKDGADTVGEIMCALHEYRAALMVSNGSGVTATYNRVHEPTGMDTQVLALRELHRNLDLAVLAAYGWEDIDPDHDFRETDEGLRFTVSDAARIEILDRLLELNHERHAAEVASGARATSRRKNTSARRGENGRGSTPALLELQ
jgi:hypothetical protein